jgi:hypothetical protein
MMSRIRGTLIIGAFAFNIALAPLPASAALDMVIGQPAVVTGKTLDDCTTRAKNALTSVMQSAVEAGTGSGDWVGVTRLEGSVSATGVIECHPNDTGYIAGFTCAVQVPPNPDSASALCGKLSAAFNAAPAATPGGTNQ